MEKKEILTVAIGLIVIISIAVWVIYGNVEIFDQSAIASEATSSALIKQRDLVIKKLMKQNAAKQEELNLAKKDLGTAEQKVTSAAAELDVSKKKIEAVKAAVQ